MLLLYLIATTILTLFLRKIMQFYKNKKILAKIQSVPNDILVPVPNLFTRKARRIAQQYYPIYRHSSLFTDIVFICHPDDIKLILSNNNVTTKSPLYKLLHKWLGTGLLTSTGQKWHQRRKLLSPAFHFTVLQKLVHIFGKATENSIQSLIPGTIDVVPMFTDLTFNSMTESVLGFNNLNKNIIEEYKNYLYENGTILVTRMNTPWYWFNFLYQFTKLAQREQVVIKVLHKFSHKLIETREKDIMGGTTDCTNLLNLLLLTKINSGTIDTTGIREEVDTFIFGGHDTTAMALSFFVLNLANNPEIQEMILNEIQINSTNGTVAYDNLKYTERCIKESLRIFPTAPTISRTAIETFCTKTGFIVPKGTLMNIQIIDVHRNPVLYPNPMKFDPDRFLPDQERHPFSYIPFSAGPRNCIGQKFAILEMKVVLSIFIQKYRFEKVDDMNDVRFKPDLVLRPLNGIRVKLVLR